MKKLVVGLVVAVLAGVTALAFGTLGEAAIPSTESFTFCSGSANASFGPDGEGPTTSGLGAIGDPDPVTDHDAVSPIVPAIVFPVDAVIIDKNPGWGLVAGSQWISYGLTTFPGPPNSTLVTFTVDFVLPPGATNPALAVTTIQDDTVDIYLNGLFEVTHGGHTQASQLTHTTTGSINPGPASNELRFDLKQLGGDGFGLDYCATVTFTPAPPGDKDGDGVPDASDNCPKTANPSQSDADGDTIGDLCDTETGVAGIGDCGDGLDNDGDGLIDGADPGCPVIYKGLEHTPLGAATLTLIADTLVVGNIGSSGDDGVSSDVSRPPPDRTLTWGFETTDTLDPAVLPTGAFRRVTLIGEIDGVPGQVAGQTTIEDVGGSLRLTPDFSSLGSSAVTINLFLGGELVGQVTGYSGPGIQIDEAFGSTITETYMWRRNGSLKSCTIITTGAHEVQVIGGPSALVDKIEVIPEGATALLNTLTNVTIEAADLPSITITDETVSGIPAVGGIAELPDIDDLTLEPAGSSDGLSPLAYAGIAGGLGAAVLAIAAGGWYARRRWLR